MNPRDPAMPPVAQGGEEVWDGRPENPERDGWHFVNGLPHGQWIAERGGYWHECGSHYSAADYASFTYGGPVPFPNELAQIRQDNARLRAALIAVDSEILLDGGIKDLVDEVLHETEHMERAALTTPAVEPGSEGR